MNPGMLYYEKMALTHYGMIVDVDTTGWTIATVPAEYLQAFTAYVRKMREYAIGRSHEPDDPGDQARLNERVLEWDDILRSLREG